MKERGAILLISCYELGRQPVGVASPFGFLERAGYAPEAIDLSVQKLDRDKLSRARCVGISVPMHTALRIGVEVARRIREIHPTCPIAFYGLYASLNGDFLLQTVADAVIGGEYETPLIGWVESLSSGRSGPVEGVRRRGETSTPLLDHLPFAAPGRSSLPDLARYAQLEIDGGRRKVGAVEASRGCRHLCRHCPIPPVYQGKFFLVPREIVLKDVRSLVRSGATHITFGDPDFLNGPNHSLRIVRAMREEFPKLTFDFTAKIEHLLKHRALLPEFAALGALFVVSAVESFSDAVLERLAKGHTRADAMEALRVVRDAGIALRPSLVPFTPWTALEEVIALFSIVEAEGLIDYVDPVQYTIRLLVPPGSLLLTEESMKPSLGPLVQEAFSYQWTHPDPRVDRLQKLFSKTVEEATEKDEDPETIFYRLKEIAVATQGGSAPARVQHRPQPGRPRPPRLTEAWFCCAEPTEGQLTLGTGGQI